MGPFSGSCVGTVEGQELKVLPCSSSGPARCRGRVRAPRGLVSGLAEPGQEAVPLGRPAGLGRRPEEPGRRPGPAAAARLIRFDHFLLKK